jgi:HD-GYP domain-containing protein (c-di-GMP phosphodiesterase class II)
LIIDKIQDRERFSARVNYLYAHKEEKSTDEIQQRNGRTLERYSAPMRGADGAYYGRVWYFRDITQRKQSESVLRRSLEDSILAFAATIESRDPYTAGHQRRVAELTVAIARDLDLPEEDIRGLQLAATIHDLGKIHIPAEILSKPGRLTPLEYELIKTHSEAGYEILKDIAFPWPIAELVLQHHERINGSGYPRGLQGEQISVGARILAVADTVEAMSSHRPYRPGFGIDAALKEIAKNRGRLYDPSATDACIKLFREKRFAFSS